MEPTSLIANANKVATPTSPEMGKIKSPEEELAFLRSQLEAKNKEIEEIKSKSILLPGATEVSVINTSENLPVNETGANKNAEVGNIVSNEIANKEIAPKETAIVEMTPAPASTIETAPLGTAHEVIKDYANTPHEEVLHKDFALAPEKVEEIVLDLAPEEHDGKIAEILGIMQVHGIRNALEVVNKMNDPHVQDDFERFLVQYAKAGFPLKGLAEKEPEFKALHMTLYEITLPEKTDEGKERALKELLSSMEQFYAGMMSVDADGGSGGAGGGKGTGYFTIELAVSNNSDDFSFHVAVHDSKKSLFEKQILSIFHNAKIIEKKNDYNIFNEGGAVSASYVMVSKDSVWPLKTYEQFDHDPLNVILNSFSKIKTNGEGASIQIVVKPQSSTHISRYKKILEDVKKGVKPSEAIAKNASGMLKHVEGFFKKAVSLTYSEEEKKKQEEKKKEEATHIDQVAIEQIQAKIASPVVSINIRLIASAENQAESDQILADIESAFNQFENTNGNKIVCERAESKGGLGSIVSSIGAGSASLKSLLYNYSFRIFDEKRVILTNLKELTTLIHFPVTGLKSAPHLKTAKAGTAPAPIDLPREGSGVLLGVNRDRAKETRIFMTPEDRLRHLYVIGQTGTGKTTMLKNMIAQDIANGEGVCMIDPHGSDIQDILALIPKHRYEDVIYFDPSDTARPLALNMLEYDPRFPEQKTFVVNEMLSIFNKLFDMKVAGGPMFEQYFRNSVLLAMEDPDSGNTLLDVSRILANKAFRELKISKCKNPIVVQFWKEVAEKAGGEASLANIVPYITSKFDVFLSNDIMRPIIAQEKSSLNFREIMDTKKILLVNLSKGRLGDINANLIGLILVGKILMAALSRVDQIGAPAGGANGAGSVGGGMASLPPFYLYIDEFQNVTTNSISTILSEARKYKLSLAVAHQFIAQLEEGIRDSVFGNVGSIASFRVGAEDAEYLEKQFSPVFTAKDLMSVDNRNAYIKMLANGRPVKPFNIETMAPPAPIGNASSVQAVKELSKLKYGRDRAVVEEEIMKKYKK